jgi:hypothetical protein
MGILRHTQGRGDIKAHPKDAQLGLPEVPLMGLERPPRAGFLCNSFQLILLTINGRPPPWSRVKAVLVASAPNCSFQVLVPR